MEPTRLIYNIALISLMLCTLAKSTVICTDECEYSGDSECDDGVTNATTAKCDYGTDCTDCGARDTDVDMLCTDICDYAGDSQCYDGGFDAPGYECKYGTDCTDCGPREPFPGYACWNTCMFTETLECEDQGDDPLCAYGTDCLECGPRDNFNTSLPYCKNNCGDFIRDGVCDDGGPGANTSYCFFGTDCEDCGARLFYGDERLCDNTCVLSNDGMCQDGGLASFEAFCYYGTDCSDCGARYYGLYDGPPITPTPGNFTTIVIQDDELVNTLIGLLGCALFIIIVISLVQVYLHLRLQKLSKISPGEPSPTSTKASKRSQVAPSRGNDTLALVETTEFSNAATSSEM